MVPLLDTPRLFLRMFKGDDLDAYHAMCADPEVMRFIGEGAPLSRTDAWRHIAVFLGTWQLRGYGTWVVEEKTSGKFLGRVGYIHPEGWPGVELGWALARPFWGQGFAVEAARACLDYGFSTLKLSHVISLIRPENHRSIALAKRLGEHQEGVIDILGKQALIYGVRKES